MKELNVAIDAAQAAASIIMEYYGKEFEIHHKGEINLVTEVDEKAQQIICDHIESHFPDDAILAEEGQLSETHEAPRRWIVDPIDGTTNFAHGYPMFCVSIAFELEGKIVAGVIYHPPLKEMFTAIRGKGAKLNDSPMKVSKAVDLRQSLLVTGFPYDLDDPEFNNIPHFCHMIQKAQAVRRDGSAAQIFIILLNKFPNLETTAYLLIFAIGAKLVIDGFKFENVNFHSTDSPAFWIFWSCVAAFIIFGCIRPKAKKEFEKDIQSLEKQTEAGTKMEKDIISREESSDKKPE